MKRNFKSGLQVPLHTGPDGGSLPAKVEQPSGLPASAARKKRLSLHADLRLVLYATIVLLTGLGEAQERILFWSGRDLSGIRPLELPAGFSLGTACLAANTKGPFMFAFGLIRNGKCLILGSQFVRETHPEMLVQNDDVIFGFKKRDETLMTKCPVIAGEAAERIILDAAKLPAAADSPDQPTRAFNPGGTAPPDNQGVFWAAKASDKLRSWRIKPWHVIRHGIELGCLMEPRTASGVLVRDKRCYVFPLHLPDTAGNLPILPGDQFFLFHGQAELKALGMKPLTGDDALTTLLAAEAFRQADHGSPQKSSNQPAGTASEHSSSTTGIRR